MFLKCRNMILQVFLDHPYRRCVCHVIAACQDSCLCRNDHQRNNLACLDLSLERRSYPPAFLRHKTIDNNMLSSSKVVLPLLIMLVMRKSSWLIQPSLINTGTSLEDFYFCIRSFLEHQWQDICLFGGLHKCVFL